MRCGTGSTFLGLHLHLLNHFLTATNIQYDQNSQAVSKSGGKETFEFIALKKASDLAARKKALQLQVYRKASAKMLVRSFFLEWNA